MPPAYLLIPENGGEKKFSLDQGHTWKIGRNEDNEVVIFNDLISRHHALLQHNGAGEYYLMDMGSRNGSFVNGSRVSFPVAIKDGDQISLGDYLLSFHWPEGAALAAAQAAPAAPVSGSPTRALFAVRKSSVLVVDVRGFTQMTQQIDPPLLCSMIGTWFREGGQIMQDQGSWTQKYIGDALMAVWVHRNFDQEALEIWRILKACVELVNLTATLQSRFGLPIPIRVGMGFNTGNATVGNAGSAGTNDYTALGDMVNAAFRFESATKAIGVDVILGPVTFECLCRCSDPQPYFAQYSVELKGYDKPSLVWATSFEHLKAFVQVPTRTQNGA